MLKYHILFPGKARQILGVDECKDYQTRLQGRIEIHYLANMGVFTQKMGEFAPADTLFCALDVLGEATSSEQLAVFIDKNQIHYRHLLLLIGSADGLPADILKQCQHKFSLGRITLPHQFMPVILCEQLYRAESINKGAPYHLGHKRSILP